MNSKIARSLLGTAALCGVLGMTAAQPALAQNVTVIVNGQQMSFDQPPVERAGRVFVPLRGIFERLGASVVYSGGVINATGAGRTVQLHIGSTQATVNGQTQYLDVAPFLIGARTLVPLRFIAQSLGAAVDWNNSTSTVTITSGGGGGGGSAPTAAPNASFYLNNKTPTGNVSTSTPAIHATFSEPVRRDSLHVSIDGNDVTPLVYANPNGFDVTPSSALSSGTHRVHVTGDTEAGASFSTGWSFTIGGSATNYIRAISPAPNTTVQSNFTLKGNTAPGSHVHIVASGEANAFGGLLQVGTGTFQTDVTADGNGAFGATIAVNAVSGGHVRVIIQSTAPDGSSAERSFTFNT